jgi:protein Tex
MNPAPRTESASLAARIAAELGVNAQQVEAVQGLLAGGGTVPFIARYRKEVTGALDEVQIRAIEERTGYLQDLEARRVKVLEAIAGLGQLNPALEAALRAATTKAELEDLYLPYKPKRRTRAAMARERGLEGLADAMWQSKGNPAELARAYVSKERDVPDVEAALAGARDICAERLSESPQLRKRAREEFRVHAVVRVVKNKAHRESSTKFDAFSDFREKLGKLPGHRWLAIERGKTEGVLKVSTEFDTGALQRIAGTQLGYRPNAPWTAQLEALITDALDRLIVPSAESEVTSEVGERAEAEAIGVFATNLKQLLLAPAFGGKRVLGIDPGQRTGCKCVVVDETGSVVAHQTLYLVQGPKALDQSINTLRELLRRYRVSAIAIGNGTHGRETERFVRDVLREHPNDNPTSAFCVSISEAGASVYSASDVAREEFPDLDVSVRGAVSIARRLQDPLAELVKIDPKSIGVGQYQHDVNQSLLARKLEEVVESCVNSVGVELNTSSAELLAYVAGIGKKLAKQIVTHRTQQGAFASRNDLLRVKGLGEKAFEQAAGFLRIQSATNPLDRSAVHPEAYPTVLSMAKDLKVNVADLVGNISLLSKLELSRYEQKGIGKFTLTDIVAELRQPGRDPRADFESLQFDDAVQKLEDLREGMQLSGVVTNVTAFGAFVDIGVHQDGLVHVSQLADRFVKDPMSVVHVGDRLQVRVLSVDLARKRVSLSARKQ